MKNLRAVKFSVIFKGFFYQLPASVVTDIKNSDRLQRIVELCFSVDEERGQYYYARRRFDKNAWRQEYISNDTCLSVDKEEPLWVLKPDMMRDVAIPADDEEETKRYLKMQGYGVEERCQQNYLKWLTFMCLSTSLLIEYKSTQPNL